MITIALILAVVCLGFLLLDRYGKYLFWKSNACFGWADDPNKHHYQLAVSCSLRCARCGMQVHSPSNKEDNRMALCCYCRKKCKKDPNTKLNLDAYRKSELVQYKEIQR